MFTARDWFLINKATRLKSLSFRKALLLIFFLVGFGLFKANGQRDVIITQANEEIRCRILDETPTRFLYACIGPKGKVLRNEIFKNLVKNFKYNHYDTDLVATDFEKNKSKESKKAKGNESLEKNMKAEILSDSTLNQQVVKGPELVVSKKGESKLEIAPVQPLKVSESKVVKAPQEVKKSATAESKVETKVIASDKPISAQPLTETSTKKPDKKAIKPALTSVEAVVSETDKLTVANKKIMKEESLITNPSDSLEAKETVIASDVSKTAIPKSPVPVIAEDETKPSNEYKNYLKWRVGAKAGIGNIRDNSFEATNAFGLYQEKLLKGWTFGADLAFFPMEGFGLGVVYTDFQSSNSAPNLNYINPLTGAETTGSVSNKVSRKFIGPAVFLRKSIDYKTFVVFGVSPGMYLYSDKGQLSGANFDYKGKEFGGAATLGLDFLLGNDIIGRDIILSLEAGYNNGKLNGIDYGDGSGEILLDKPLIMDRLDFSIGLRFMRFPKYLKK